jgi:hypothetical protein
LYPKFRDADHTGWQTAWTRALQGNENCLEAVGHKGAASQHPVCKALLASIGPAGSSGTDLRRKFEAPEYGWPRDAVHAGLAALVLATDVNAEENGSPVTTAQFKPNMVGKLVFRREVTAVPLPTRLAVQQVLTEANVSFQKNEEAVACASLLPRLADLANQAGGQPPFPQPPSAEFVAHLKGLKGNELILGVHKKRDEIRAAIKEWQGLIHLKESRLDAFNKAARLVKHLPEGDPGRETASQLRAVETERQLLSNPDPVAPIISDAAKIIRQEIQVRVERYNNAIRTALGAVSADSNWKALSDDQRSELLGRYEMSELSLPSLGSAEEVLAAVESRPLASWDDRVVAVEARIGRIREAAARILEPQAHRTSVPPANLQSSEEVHEYVEALRKQLLRELQEHKSLII